MPLRAITHARAPLRRAVTLIWTFFRRPPAPTHARPQAHNTYITKCLISPDCRRLATTSADQSVKIWDMASNFREDKSLLGHQRWVWDAVFSADSAYLVTASSDQTARLWDVAQGETIRHYTGHHKAVICVALHDRASDG